MLLQGADAVADGGGGNAELLAGQHEALVAGSGLEEAQAFERGKVKHGEDPVGVRWQNAIISSHIHASQTKLPVAGGGLEESQTVEKRQENHESGRREPSGWS